MTGVISVMMIVMTIMTVMMTDLNKLPSWGFVVLGGILYNRLFGDWAYYDRT